jgi:ankyrin repeat protein
MKERETGIHANRLIEVMGDQVYQARPRELSTPISRATLLGQTAVVRVLLKQGAQVDYKPPGERSPSVIDKYINECKGKTAGRVQFDHQLFKLLYEAGSTMSDSSILTLLEISQDSASHFILKELPKRMRAWVRGGHLSKAFRRLDQVAILAIIDKMTDLGFDANDPLQEYVNDSPRKIYLMDIAIARKMPRMAHTLESYGAVPKRFLLQAINLFAEGQVRFLVEEVRVPVLKNVRVQECPFQMAVDCKNVRAIQYLLQWGIREGMDLDQQRYWNLQIRKLHESQLPRCDVPKADADHQAERLADDLWDAVDHRQNQRVEYLLDCGADATIDHLLNAITQPNTELVHSLLQHDVDPNEVSEINFDNPLHVAIQESYLDIAKMLLETGAQVDRPYDPLFIAIETGSLDMVDLLIEYGADLNGVSDPEDYGGFCAYYRAEYTSLGFAVHRGEERIALRLLEAGAEPYDETALEIAVEDNEELFETLLKACKRRYPRGKKYFDVCSLSAIRFADEPLILKILEFGEDCTRLRPFPAYDCVDILHGEGVEKITPLGYSLLLKSERDYSVMRLLLAEGNCDLTRPICMYKDRSHLPLTALMAAICARDAQLLELLFEYGAQINPEIRPPFKYTPLQWAANLGTAKMVGILIAKGADVNAPPARRRGGTALQLASRGGWGEIVVTLLNRGADVDAEPSNANGRYALEEAAENGRLDTVKILLNAGASTKLGVRDQISNGIRLAEKKDHTAVCEFLRDYHGPTVMSNEIQQMSDDPALPMMRMVDMFVEPVEEEYIFHGAVYDIGP